MSIEQLPPEKAPLLDVTNIKAGYGRKSVLKGISLNVNEGEIVSIIGHNGAGKSTLLKVIFGLLPIIEGELQFEGTPLLHQTPRELLGRGVAYVPQGNRVFQGLSVKENLELAAMTISKRKIFGEGMTTCLNWFPELEPLLKRSAGTLSGGEKQMLALSCGLITAPRLLLLDEPSLGLSPPLISNAFSRIKSISCDRGVAILVVEQKVRKILEIADRVYVFRNGQVSFQGPAKDLQNEDQLRSVYL